MSKPTNSKSDALAQYFEPRGNLAKLAHALGVSKQRVWQWKERGWIPVNYCPPAARVLGARLEELNPNVDWTYLRQQLTETEST
jgi:DNA-binding transcriptional regulator YdaS (Cro superfamily)